MQLINKCWPLGPLVALVCMAILATLGEARSMRSPDYDQEAASAVIPSPNQPFDDEFRAGDIIRKTQVAQSSQAAKSQAQAASPVPVYVSQYVVPGSGNRYASQQEPSLASVDFANPGQGQGESRSASLPETRSKDLKVAESYGHGEHGSHHGAHYRDHDEHHGKGHGYDNSGWLDMGAYTGKKGAFGWHADFPVGGKHGYGR